MATVAAQRAGVAAAAGPAAFLVLGEPMETAVVRVLVDLGAAQRGAAAHEEDGGFLAALQPLDDGVDDTVIDQGLQGVGGLQRPRSVPVQRAPSDVIGALEAAPADP